MNFVKWLEMPRLVFGLSWRGINIYLPRKIFFSAVVNLKVG